MTNEQSNNALTQEQVLAYLQENPQFFCQHAEVIRNIDITDTSGETVSIASYQLKELREHCAELENQLSHIHGVAAQNDALLRWYLKITLDCLSSTDLASLTGYCIDQCVTELKLDAASFILFNDQLKNTEHLVISNKAESEKYLPSAITKPFCGVVREEAMQYLFQNQGQGVKSVAILPLGEAGLLGYFAVGSNDAMRFDSTMDTLFLDYLSTVLTHFIERHSG